MRKTAFVLLITLLLSAIAVAADTYQTGKIVKWDNGTYPDGKKTKAWIVYQVQGDNLLYSIARHKETKPQMQPGDAVQYQVKGNKMTVVNAKGKKETTTRLWASRKRRGSEQPCQSRSRMAEPQSKALNLEFAQDGSRLR